MNPFPKNTFVNMVTFKKYYDEALMQINSTSICLKKGLMEILQTF